MKFLEFTFDDYLTTIENDGSLHPQLHKVFKAFPDTIENFRNIIIYGPKGSGKYSQALSSICKYSPTKLKYTRKFTITSNKNDYNFKMSDIHFEVDMFLLGCNAKQLWNDIYVHVLDILSSRATSSGIILCKNFQDIHGELLENFYSYMQKTHTTIQLRFVIVTEHVSFLPDNIINSCYIISVPAPTESVRSSILSSKQKNFSDKTHGGSVVSLSSYNESKTFDAIKLEKQAEITEAESGSEGELDDEESNDMYRNFESIMMQKKSNLKAEVIGLPSEICDFTYAYCNELCTYIDNPKTIDFLRFRDVLYDMLIYDIKVTNVLWTILRYITVKYKLSEDTYDRLIMYMYTFLQYFNNNYRPIYHLESYLFKIINTIHFSSNLIQQSSCISDIK